MKAEVYDTYVTKADGRLMHFDIIVPAGTTYETVLSCGRTYLMEDGEGGQTMKAAHCRFCHIEEASAEMTAAFEARGFFILPMEGCPAPHRIL